MLVAQIIVCNNIPDIETISTNIKKKKYFENYSSYCNNRDNTYTEVELRYNEEKEVNSLSEHNIKKNDNYTMSMGYSDRYVNTDSESDETTHLYGSSVCQAITYKKNDHINSVESVYFENKLDLSQYYLDRELGQTNNIHETNYKTLNNSEEVIANKLEVDKKNDCIAHLCESNIDDIERHVATPIDPPLTYTIFMYILGRYKLILYITTVLLPVTMQCTYIHSQ